MSAQSTWQKLSTASMLVAWVRRNAANEAAMPAHDRVRGDQAMATQCPGQPPHERREHRAVRPVQAWPWVGATQDGDLVT
jgi:hypothetical protein